MAKIATTHQEATVIAEGDELNATANVSGELMEMLATVYVYILMAAIREAIQNACDAARRAGQSFADGVQVLLPTAANPVITVIDKGAGMTKAFMESTTGYLSFGTSTKNRDNGAAGGLGVGRWAAYGYIGECFITTCHESDMVERTYFQYRGKSGKPSVRPAAEVPGTVAGTRVYFPVKETDIAEAYRAVAWLKEVMQLTMGDSFSVDQPSLLPTMLPSYSGVSLKLGEFDPGLEGVVVYPMQGSSLKYGRQGVQPGSLVVLTNQEAGVGGLPFHVQSPTDKYSVFSQGMVVEIPMSSHNVPFMPSREELKYTDETSQLLRRIDAAAAQAMIAKAEALFAAPDLASKAALTRLLGTFEHWNWCGMANRDDKCPQHTLMNRATGGRAWNGSMTIAVSPGLRRDMDEGIVRAKLMDARVLSMREARASHNLTVYAGDGDWLDITFNPVEPLLLVVNDVAKYGQKRFRDWMVGRKVGKCIFFYGKNPADAASAAVKLNATFGGALPIVNVSSMPDVERRIVGGAVVRSTSKGNLSYYSTVTNKQESKTMSFTTLDEEERARFWVEKDGGKLAGFKETSTLSSLDNWEGGLKDVLNAARVTRLYLLTPKQAAELRAAQAEVEDFDLEELQEAVNDGDADARESLDLAKALAMWKPLDAALMELTAAPAVKAVLDGKAHTKLSVDTFLSSLCHALAKRPRMELTGTRFDRAIAPFVDVLSCTVHLMDKLETPHQRLHEGLTRVGQHLEVRDEDTDERKEMVFALAGLMAKGHIDYASASRNLKETFPLLKTMYSLNGMEDKTLNDLSQAIAVLYR